MSRGGPRATRLGLGAWALYDWASSAFAAVIQTFVFPAYFVRRVAATEGLGSAQWGTALSLAGLAVALLGPLLGAIADHSGRRKRWLAGGTLLCVAATAGLWGVRPSSASVWLALGLVGLGTVGTEVAQIFYNAMLPDLAPPNRVGRWSGWGWGAGYVGGLACLLLAGAMDVRAGCLLVAGWYLVFALPLFAATPDAPATGKPLSAAIRDGLAQLAETGRRLRRYGPLVRFLIARMLYVDGLATLFVFGGIYAAGVLGLSERDVVRVAVALNVTSALGAAGCAWLDDRLGSRRTILLSLAGLIAATTGALLARSPALVLGFGLLLGIFIGPVQAASRSLMARYAPAELRNEMFGLYALSGRLTTFLGPLSVGWITYWTGSQRLGMGVVIVFLLAGWLLMWTVPPAPRQPD